VVSSILFAGYLFAYSLFTSVWNGYAVPHSLSTRLLGHLQLLTSDDSWTLHEKVLFWCTIIGGSLSPLDITRDRFVVLLQEKFRGQNGCTTDFWPTIEPISTDFYGQGIALATVEKRFGRLVLLYAELSIAWEEQT
jgi:hypothetical protein